MARIFMIHVDVLKEQVLLVVGGRWKDIEGDLVQAGVKKKFRRFVKDAMTDQVNKAANGFVAHNGGTLLVMPAYHGGRGWLALLVHELNHVVYFIASKRGMLEEMEAVAHLQEWLFTSILELMDEEDGQNDEVGTTSRSADAGGGM